MIERIPPHSQDAEQALLGAMLIDSRAIGRASEVLRNDRRFYTAVHRKIYTAIVHLYAKAQPADITTVAEELERTGDLVVCGGRSYLVSLAAGVATGANAEYYAGIVLEKAILRDLIETSSDIVNQAYRQEKETTDLLNEAEQRLFELSAPNGSTGWAKVGDLMPDLMQQLQERYDAGGGVIGVSSGFMDVDTVVGGFQEGDLVIIAGRPSMGKSALAVNIAENSWKSSGKAVAIFSLEMPKPGLALRILCGDAGINAEAARRGKMSESDWGRAARSVGNLETMGIYIDDCSQLTPMDIRSRLRRLESRHDLGLVVVDYLQLMDSDRGKENRQQEVSDISRRLKGIAKEFRVPVVGVSQLSRAVESRADRRPQLSDLRESGAIEQDADIVMLLYRPEYYLQHLEPDDPRRRDVAGMAELNIAKNRNGNTGNVKLMFRRELVRFENLAHGERGK